MSDSYRGDFGIVRLQRPHTLAVHPNPPGDQIGILGASGSSTIVWAGDGRLTLDAPLSGAAVGATLLLVDSSPGTPIGTSRR